MKKRKIIISLLLAASVETAAMPVSAAAIEGNECSGAAGLEEEYECGGVIDLPADADAGWDDEEELGSEEIADVEDIDSEENVDNEEAGWEHENSYEDEEEIDWNDDGTEDAEGNWTIAVDYDVPDADPVDVEFTECDAPAGDGIIENEEDGGAEAAFCPDNSFTGPRENSDAEHFQKAEYAASRDDALAGIYANAENAAIRSGAGEEKTILTELKQDARVYCYGYYTEKDGEKWLYVQYVRDGMLQTGFCNSSSLK